MNSRKYSGGADVFTMKQLKNNDTSVNKERIVSF